MTFSRDFKIFSFLTGVVLAGAFFLPLITFAQNAQSGQIGFPDQPIWYSEDPFFADEEVTIYTLVVNSGSSTLEGVVEFFDGDGSLGTRSFSIPPNGGSKVLSLPWTPTEGMHRISAKIKEAFIIENGMRTAIAVPNSVSGSDERVVTVRGDKDNGAAIEKAEELANAAIEKIPEPIKEKTTAAANSLESFRVERAEKMEDGINDITLKLKDFEEKKEARPAGSVHTPEDGDEAFVKPLQQIKRFFLQIGFVIFKTKALFYIVGAGAVILILRWAYRMIFKRNEF